MTTPCQLYSVSDARPDAVTEDTWLQDGRANFKLRLCQEVVGGVQVARQSAPSRSQNVTFTFV